MDDKIRVQRLRRKALRQDLVLRRSRRRDRDATDFGRWYLIRRTGKVILSSSDLSAVEAYLYGG